MPQFCRIGLGAGEPVHQTAAVRDALGCIVWTRLTASAGWRTASTSAATPTASQKQATAAIGITGLTKRNIQRRSCALVSALTAARWPSGWMRTMCSDGGDEGAPELFPLSLLEAAAWRVWVLGCAEAAETADDFDTMANRPS